MFQKCRVLIHDTFLHRYGVTSQLEVKFQFVVVKIVYQIKENENVVDMLKYMLWLSVDGVICRTYSGVYLQSLVLF